jgi:7,8-dihydroneopterin aldolase/epimerase/oxygenase
MGKILLEEIEFYAYHGYFPEEQKIGGKYLVNIELEADFGHAARTDNLESTINYAQVYEIVRSEMNISSKLIEHVAGRILKAMFDEFERLDFARIKLTKVNPPVEGQLKSVAIILEERRKK